ncbi:MAG: terpene cyclase/mutase family protein [Planctomycetes bacterium]|nr:terpene cyclase/mutase family protein [Planctomycetota bacterium]
MKAPRHAAIAASIGVAAAVGVGLAPATGRAQGRDAPPAERGRPGDGEVDARARKAIQRGLDFLARRQEPDGSYVDGIGRKVNNTYLATVGPHVGVTALAGMAFLSNGSTPGRGPYGRQVQGCVDFVKGKVNAQGFITNQDSRMYSHAFATLFLAEVYGMAPSQDVLHALRRSARLIVTSQNEQGGWRYQPGAKDSDISITVCQVQALRAANNVGVQVPRETIEAAMSYVKRSYVGQATSFQNQPGGFWYQVHENFPLRPSRTSFALTAAGVTALYGAGEYDGPEIRGGLRFLFDPKQRPRARDMDDTFDYFYGHYYAVQAFFQAGEPYWSQWFPSLRDEIVAGQKPDGRWQDLVGPNYATSMACIILQIPYRYLPIFER